MTKTDQYSALWDNRDCPNDCNGQLQQQDKYNVMCTTCKEVFTHVRNQNRNGLANSDGDIVVEIEE